MAWAQGDQDHRDNAKLQLALMRSQSYKLLRACQAITHPEKGPRLVQLAEQLKAIEDDIEFQLNR